MLSSYQEGRRARPNAVASLTGNGHLSPHSRHLKAGAVQYAHRPGPTSRPGPAPASARQIAAQHASQSQTKRYVDQMQDECQRAVQESNAYTIRQAASISLSQLEAHRPERHGDGQHVEIAIPGTFRSADALRYRQGNLWIYATTFGDGWQDHVYYVYNPETKVILEFKPAGASRGAQLKNIAAYTGRVGGYIEKTYLVVAVGAVGLAAAAEVGGYYWATEEAIPFLSRVSMRAWQVAKPAISQYARKAAKGAFARVFIDGTTQLVSGSIAKDGDLLEAFYGINYTSLFLSAAVNTQELKLGAKLLVGTVSAALSNGLSASAENYNKDGNPFHLVKLNNRYQVLGYIGAVAWSVPFDLLKDIGGEKGAKLLSEQAIELAKHSSGRVLKAIVRTVSEKQVSLGLVVTLGTAFELPKKMLLEPWWERLGEAAEEKGEAAHAPVKKVVTRLKGH